MEDTALTALSHDTDMMMPLQFSERRKFLSRVVGGLGARPQPGTRGTIRASEERIVRFVTANGE